jgi:hypothetical protein
MTKKRGKCHLCSEEKDLTFEHVPPKSAFNKSSDLISYKFDSNLRKWIPSKQNPYGVGEYTLCAKCNNETGGTYGQAFCDLINQVADVSNALSDYRVMTEITHKGFLHRVLKQIVTMFCSTNGDSFTENHTGLKEYLLDQKSESYPEGIYIYTYLINRVGKLNSGCQGVLNLRTNKTIVCSEILFWPLGYIMSFEKLESSDIKDAILTDITHWKDYPIDKRETETISLAKNYRLVMFPLDFRSKDEIEKQSGTSINPPGVFPFIDYEL